MFPHISWTHILWTGFIALMIWPAKKIGDWVIEKFWDGFIMGFKNSPGGKDFFSAFYTARAKKDQEIAAKHPELTDVLHHKACAGKGCADCGMTGWS